MSIRLMSAVAALAIAGAAAADDSSLYDEYWDYELRHDPFAATTSGDYRFNDQVPDVSDTAQQARLQQLRLFESRLKDASSQGDPMTAEILGFILKHDLALGDFGGWRIPFNSDSGFHMNIGYVVSSTRFESADDYRDYLQRLAALPGYFSQHTSNMRAGLDAGFTQPAEIMDKILPSFEAQVTKSAKVHPCTHRFRK